jgi:hypothetical protein
VEILRNKHLLLDTNILINSAKYPLEFETFFEELSAFHIVPIIDEAIKLEFLRSANTQKKLLIKINYLTLLLGNDQKRLDLPITIDTLVNARRFSNLSHYLNLKKQSISLGDSILSAQLKKYSGSLYLATMNHKDFPLRLFNRVLVKNIETSDELFTIGIYGFSESKYNEVVDSFTKTE